MPKFKKGEYVIINEGVDEGNIGVIDEITFRENKFIPGANEARYRVCTINNPKGILLNESKLDIMYDDKLFEEAVSKSHLFCEMASVKWGFESIKLGVFEDEPGNIPHFHFYRGIAPEKGVPKNARSGGGCICIEKPNYFIHASHKDTMSIKEIKGLIEFLNSPHKSITNITNWEYIISLWNDNNPMRKQVPLNIPIPKYKNDMESVTEK